MKEVFEGETINTPSMLCVEDYLDALAWAERIGGLQALFARADANARVLLDWAERTPWLENLAVDPATRSNTSVCLKIVDPVVARLPRRCAARLRQAAGGDARQGECRARHRRPPRCAAVACASGAARRWRRPTWRRSRRGSTGPSPRQGRPRQGGLNQRPLSSNRATCSTRAGGLSRLATANARTLRESDRRNHEQML